MFRLEDFISLEREHSAGWEKPKMKTEKKEERLLLGLRKVVTETVTEEPKRYKVLLRVLEPGKTQIRTTTRAHSTYDLATKDFNEISKAIMVAQEKAQAAAKRGKK